MCRIPGQVVLGRFHIYEYGVLYQSLPGLRVANLDNFWIDDITGQSLPVFMVSRV